MEPPSLAGLADAVVAWHNRHPLALRIDRAQVTGAGWVVLPFERTGGDGAAAPVLDDVVVDGLPPGEAPRLRDRAAARAQAQRHLAAQASQAGPGDARGGDDEAAAAGAPSVAGAHAGGDPAAGAGAFGGARASAPPAARPAGAPREGFGRLRAAFAADALSPLSAARIGAFAQRHAVAASALPSGVPVQRVAADAARSGGDGTRVDAALRCATVAVGGRRLRVLVAADGGAAPAVLGSRCGSLRRLGTLVALPLALLAGGTAWRWPTVAVEPVVAAAGTATATAAAGGPAASAADARAVVPAVAAHAAASDVAAAVSAAPARGQAPPPDTADAASDASQGRQPVAAAATPGSDPRADGHLQNVIDRAVNVPDRASIGPDHSASAEDRTTRSEPPATKGGSSRPVAPPRTTSPSQIVAPLHTAGPPAAPGAGAATASTAAADPPHWVDEAVLGRVALPSLGPFAGDPVLTAARARRTAARTPAAAAAVPAAPTSTPPETEPAVPATVATAAGASTAGVPGRGVPAPSPPPGAAPARPGAAPAASIAAVPAVPANRTAAAEPPAAAPTESTVFALTTRVLRTAAEGEQLAAAMQSLLQVDGPAAAVRIETVPMGADRRVVAYPFDSREAAQRAHARLAGRGLRVEVVTF